MLTTSHSLIQRACRLEPAAWERLCALYGPIIYGWCRRGGLQDSDAADAVQEVFRSVFTHLDQFRRQGGVFHAWLWQITINQVRLHFRQRQRNPIPTDDNQVQQWPDCGDGDEPELESTRQRILRRALDLIRGDFSEQTWSAFARITLKGESCQEVAATLGMTSNAVRQARFRVVRRLRQELDGLL
ncbi:MAG TPA: sigma-70 family RNA polymerase sigma factor [Methylomirabilota bacterium]|nr:sigma-70 family RNA polymerase sigma factor [Methylomirabilota bacterium]